MLLLIEKIIRRKCIGKNVLLPEKLKGSDPIKFKLRYILHGGAYIMQRFDELKVGYNYENEMCRGI